MICVVMPGTEVDSFVVRFAKKPDSQECSQSISWYGLIRHIQSDRQLRFTNIKDALSFMAGFVQLEEETGLDNERR